MIRKLGRLYRNTTMGYYIIRPFYLVYEQVIKLMPDETYIKYIFKKHMGYPLDLENPKTLNEKINWLKLNDRTELHTISADKYAVRDFIKKNIGEEYIVPLLYRTKDPKDIRPENLPNVDFIIKTNHNSSGGIIVKDKSKIDWKKTRYNFNKLLKENYFYASREWQYKNIEPCIIVEKLLTDSSGNIPFDYKIHCFNGKVRMIQVDIDRNSDNHHRNWYSRTWEREPYKWSSPKPNGKFTDPSDYDVEKPKSLEKMISLSEKLAKHFTYVRVDWYDVDGTLFFGELTFHHDGGTKAIKPKEWDEKLGDELRLPFEN